MDRDIVRRSWCGSLSRPGVLNAALLTCALVLSACGGGNSGSAGGSSGEGSAPSGLSYPAAPALLVGTAITPLAPRVSGSVTSYSVSPALPAGLTLSAATGVISGTPTAAVGQGTYNVTASNAVGSTSANVSLDITPGLAYVGSGSFTAGVAGKISPTAVPPETSSLDITPALPAGLAFDTSSGVISGTPAAASGPTQYVIKATSPAGTSTASLTLTVAAGPLLDLGHAGQLALTRLIGTALLSQDTSGHWVLWNYATGASLANGDSPGDGPLAENSSGNGAVSTVDLAGSTVVIQTSTGLEVRSAASGSVLAEIAVPLAAGQSWWKLASDGSYVCAGNATALTAWSPAGTTLFSRSGNYSAAAAFAGPGQIQVALGAAGSSVIESLAVPGGTSTIGPTFNGQFQSWFTDGGRFLTAVGTTVWVYSSASVQQDLASLPTTLSLTGQGNWYWTVSGCCSPTFTLYAVGSAGRFTLTQSFGLAGLAVPVPSAHLVGLLTSGALGAGQLTILDLAGATPVSTNYTAPVAALTALSGTSSSVWVTGNGLGVLYDGASSAGTPRYLDYGAALSIAGSTTNAVIATASGRILYFDAATHALQGTINALAAQVALSSDGSVLAATPGGGSINNSFSTDDTITVYSLPAAAVTASFPFATSAGQSSVLTSMTLSGSGNALLESFYTVSPCSAQVVLIATGTTTWCSTAAGSAVPPAVQLSPDGTLVAVSVSSAAGVTTTNIYQNGTLVTAIPAFANGWIDDNDLLVSIISNQQMSTSIYVSGSSIYNAAGQLVQTLPSTLQGPPPEGLPTASIQPLSSTSIYSSAANLIYSLTAGLATWQTGSPASFFPGLAQYGEGFYGAVSGTDVVFESGHLILAEPY